MRELVSLRLAWTNTSIVFSTSEQYQQAEEKLRPIGVNEEVERMNEDLRELIGVRLVSLPQKERYHTRHEGMTVLAYSML